MGKVSTFVIMIVIFSLFLVTAIRPILDYGDERYGITDYNASRIDSYNQINEIQGQAQDIKNKTLTLQSKSGVIDVLGGFFESGFDALKITFSSFGNFLTQVDLFFGDIGIFNANVFKVAFITIALLLIVFIIISTVVKREV